MAKKRPTTLETPDTSAEIPDTFSAKLRKLIIRNFGCIGSTPVAVDLDDIVVLVGTNNAGKSTILRAYHVLFSSSDPKLRINDFPNHTINPHELPEIELHTAVQENPPGHKWIQVVDGENIIKERWRWESADSKAIRQGFDVQKNEWSEQVPWGAANVANARRPKPYRIEAFSDPTEQADYVVKLLKDIMTSNLKDMPEETIDESGTPTKTDYGNLLEQLAKVQQTVLKNVEEQITDAERRMTAFAAGIFHGYRVQFDARSDEGIRESLNFFKAEPQLRMGPEDGHLSTADRQGSGAQRTLMWSALRYAAETKLADDAKTQFLLLLDEPELCLHPNAIREACRVLYDLPTTGRWQVMLTTHSPIFIDLSRDNTTVVRVDRNPKSHVITGTTVFRPNRVTLSNDDKELLKTLNVFDPYVSEFFFGGHTILVEGDTEYTAIKYVVSQYPENAALRNLHIVRARGKATICLLARILNQFDARYAVVHDADSPTTTRRDGSVITNPAWTNNQKIRESIGDRLETGNVRLVALLNNFETAFLGEAAHGDKPYNAWLKLKHDRGATACVKQLIEGLIDFDKTLPARAVDWSSIADLESFVSH